MDKEKIIEKLKIMDKICEKYNCCDDNCKIKNLCRKYCDGTAPYFLLKNLKHLEDLENEIIEIEEGKEQC